MSEFDPTKPIVLDGAAATVRLSPQSVRDPLVPFATQIDPNLVMPEHQPLKPEYAIGESGPSKPAASNTVSRRGFLGLLGAGLVVAGAAAYTIPKIAEKVDDTREVIDGAEARSRVTEMAKSIVLAGRTYLSDQLSAIAYQYDRDHDETRPYQLDKEAKTEAVTLRGIFGYAPKYDADAGLTLQVYSPESPYDGVARTNLELSFDDKTGAVRRKISKAQSTFGDLMTWTENAMAPKDPTKPEDPADPNNALTLTRIGIFAVNEDKQPPEAGWYVVEITEDGVYVLKPGSGEQADDENHTRNKDWLSPNDPNYTAAFKQTIAALKKGLQDFSDNAKNVH